VLTPAISRAIAAIRAVTAVRCCGGKGGPKAWLGGLVENIEEFRVTTRKRDLTRRAQAPRCPVELPSDTLGKWCQGETVKITRRSVTYGWGRCSVLSVDSDHPGWHTYSITMRCSRDGRRRELWHLSEIEEHPYLIQSTSKRRPEQPFPFISVLRKCD
jgi:hypothetical protein